jgi:pimeloyl-ACP methyl ester carboxylesterase
VSPAAETARRGAPGGTAGEGPEPAEGHLDVPGGRLHYLDWGGRGRPAHFLHGNGFCAGTYTPFIRMLASELRIVASDARGHGGSAVEAPLPVRDWGVFAEDVARLVAAVLAPPVIGLGHSLGAVATLMAAARRPELFAALVLIDPVLLSGPRLWGLAALQRLGLRGRVPRAALARRRRRVFRGKAEALRLFLAGRGIFKRWSPEFVEAYLSCGLLEKDAQTAVLTCDPELEAQIFESVPAGIWRTAAAVACPVLALRGEHSDVFLAPAAARLQKTLPQAEVAVIPGTGHFPPMEKPAACARLIRDFLGRLPAAPRAGGDAGG